MDNSPLQEMLLTDRTRRDNRHHFIQTKPIQILTVFSNVGVSVVLGLFEVVQHGLEVPAVVAVAVPLLVVEAVAAHVQHVVENGGAAHHLASWPVTALEQSSMSFGQRHRQTYSVPLLLRYVRSRIFVQRPYTSLSTGHR